MVKNYKITIQYDGTRYNGWQKQGNTSQTIQGKLEQILQKLMDMEIEVQASGRTDAGVHAKGQVANFHLEFEKIFKAKYNRELTKDEIKLGNSIDTTTFESEFIMDYINNYLPSDIVVTSIGVASDRFHSRLNATKKTYMYRLNTSKIRNVFDRNYVYEFGKDLDIKRMRKAAEHLIGEHDFKGFSSINKQKKSTVRKITDIKIENIDGEVRIIIKGNGFLYNMVRIIVGTLIEVGLSEKSSDDIDNVLLSKDRKLAGFMAPAKGLCLMSVDY